MRDDLRTFAPLVLAVIVVFACTVLGVVWISTGMHGLCRDHVPNQGCHPDAVLVVEGGVALCRCALEDDEPPDNP